MKSELKSEIGCWIYLWFLLGVSMPFTRGTSCLCILGTFSFFPLSLSRNSMRWANLHHHRRRGLRKGKAQGRKAGRIRYHQIAKRAVPMRSKYSNLEHSNGEFPRQSHCDVDGHRHRRSSALRRARFCDRLFLATVEKIWLACRLLWYSASRA